MKQNPCVTCGGRISKVRLETQPNAKTCTKRCADLRKKAVRKAIDKRWRERKKKEKK